MSGALLEPLLIASCSLHIPLVDYGCVRERKPISDKEFQSRDGHTKAPPHFVSEGDFWFSPNFMTLQK